MEQVLKYSQSADCFERALPIGNGSLGGMVYGKVDKERISLNHDTLWSGVPGNQLVEGAYESFRRAQKLMADGKTYEAERELEEHFLGNWVNSYLYLGNLYIERIGSQNRPDSYTRTLNLSTSLVNCVYTEDEIEFKREYFVSYPNDCLAIRLQSSKPVSYCITGDALFERTAFATEDALVWEGECPDSLPPVYDRKAKPVTFNGKGIKFHAFLRANSNGLASYADERLTIVDTTDTVLYFCVKTSFIAFDVFPTAETYHACDKASLSLLTWNYDSLRLAHVTDVLELYQRVYIDLGGAPSDLDTDLRLESGTDDASLCELLFNFGRYLTIASSREGSTATNLQGIWNESLYPEWGADYTININSEMNYWHVFMTNLHECAKPINELVKKLSVTGKELAKHFYHANGFVSHHNADIWGISNPVGNNQIGSSCFGFWNLSSGWLTRHLWEYYEYTQDVEFLENTAYPILLESAKFYWDMLVRDGDYWILTPTTSPENVYRKDGQTLHVAKYTTMSQSIVYDVFCNLVKCADVLNVMDPFVQNVAERMDKVAIFTVGSQGQLLEYDDEYEMCDVHHRHLSHLYAMCPADIITTENNKAISHAMRQTLELRGDEGTGWSMGWKVNLWAKLKDGNRAMKLIENQLRLKDPDRQTDDKFSGGTYPNLFDAHPPFQIDGNFGVTAGICQLFLQCEDGKIKILPALPDKILNGTINGLVAKGCVEVSISWQNGTLTELTLLAKKAQKVVVSYRGQNKEVILDAGVVTSVSW